MRIFFVGSMIEKQISQEIIYNSEAANNFQWNIISELKKNNDLELLSYIGYRTGKPLKVEKLCEQEKVKCYLKENGFVRSMYSNFIASLRSVKNCDVSIQYNVSYANIYIPIIGHLFNKKAYLVLADYTESIEYSSILMKIYSKLAFESMKKFDKIICLSSEMSKKLERLGKDTLVIEGGINVDEFVNMKLPTLNLNQRIIIMYSGLLSPVTGVDILLKAIEKIDRQDVEFWVTGKGELQQLVEEHAKSDNRIKYMGFIGRAEYITLLNKAHILINPRNMNMPQNRNNFPSKVMEYIASGRVIVSTKFPNWHDFEDNVFFYDNNEIINTLNNTINRYVEIYEKCYNNNRAKSIEFSWKKQVEKISKFI